MKKNIFFLLIFFLICSSFLLNMDQLVVMQLENYIKQADAADNLSKQAVQKGDKTEELTKKDEALQWYGKAAAVIVPLVPLAPTEPGTSIYKYEKEKELQEKGARKIVIETKKLTMQKKYDEAIKVYKYAGDKFKIEIAQLEALQKPPQQPIEETKKDWIFVTEMPGVEEQKTDYWRITEDPITKKHILDLNKNEKDYVAHETFTEMMQKAQDHHIPFFLVMVEFFLGTKTTIDLYEGENAFHFLVESWNKNSLLRVFIDPKTKAPIINITIFVMGDDGKFIKLKKNANTNYYLNNFVEKVGQISTETIIKPRSILSQKGKAQLFVANLFKEEAQDETNQKQKQELLQHAEQWNKFALKYLPTESPEYAKTQKEIKDILDKTSRLQKKPQKPVQDQKLLIQSLQNLTTKLRQIPTKLV